jgi:hypothetical protein
MIKTHFGGPVSFSTISKNAFFNQRQKAFQMMDATDGGFPTRIKLKKEEAGLYKIVLNKHWY